MATVYTTHQGEMVDAICRRVYGDESGYVEAVLDTNPGLAAKGTPLPMLATVFLPDVPKLSGPARVVSLWD